VETNWIGLSIRGSDSDSSLASLIVTRVESFCEKCDWSRVTIVLNVTGVESKSPKIVTRLMSLTRVTLSLKNRRVRMGRTESTQALRLCDNLPLLSALLWSVRLSEMSIGPDLDWTGTGLWRILLILDWIRTVKCFMNLGSGLVMDWVNGKELCNFVKKNQILLIFWTLFGLGF